MAKTKTESEISVPTIIKIRNYPAKLVHENKSVDGTGGTFKTISFMFKDFWASFLADDTDPSPATRRNGSLIPNRVSFTLGSPDDVRLVSIKNSDGVFERVPMFNKTIQSAIYADRQSYLRSIAI